MENVRKNNRIVSGMQPTGKLHIGNYLGALKQFVEIQNSRENECYFFIVDLHALTTPFVPAELKANILEVAAEYMAAGINPEKSAFFVQSHVPEHAELAWILNCITPLGELERMTQFKDKSHKHEKNINAGLLTYPVLMAADILLYKPALVPVGEDQQQHIELTRIIARKFNHQFGETFPEPKNFNLKPLRIMSLSNPDKKMSKTGNDGVLLSDSPETIATKFKKAVTATDAYDELGGVQNLLLILSKFGADDKVRYFENEITQGTIKYSELKAVLAETVIQSLSDFRERKAEFIAKPREIEKALQTGAEKARHLASQTLTEVKEKIGLL